MSGADWAGCGCTPGRPTRQLFKTIEEAFTLLDRESELWLKLLEEARCLIVDSRQVGRSMMPTPAKGSVTRIGD